MNAAKIEYVMNIYLIRNNTIQGDEVVDKNRYQFQFWL